MKRKNNKLEYILVILIILIISYLTIGYSVYFKDLGLNGDLSLNKIGKVMISKIELDESVSNELTSNVLTVDNEGNISLNYSKNVSREEVIESGTYLIYIENESIYDYTYTGLSINPEVEITNGNSSDGGAVVNYNFELNNKNNELEVGDIIKSGETKIAVITLTIKTGSEKNNINITINGEGNVNTSLDNSGELYGSIDILELDLKNNEIDCFNIEVINTYKYRRSFSLKSSNKNFYLVKEDGSDLDFFYIDSPNELDENSNIVKQKICLKENEDSLFLTDNAKTSIVLGSNELVDKIIGDINVLVKVTEEKDEKIPEVGNILLEVDIYDQESKSLILNTSWDRLDSGGTSIKSYYIDLYDQNSNTLIKEYSTNSDITSYVIELDNNTLESLYEDMVTNNHDYYIKVYGIDEALNSGKEYCNLNDNNYCVESSTTSLKWEFDVITNFTNISLSSNSPKKVYLNNPYSANLEANTNYSLPSKITVLMNEEELILNTDYTYSSASNGSLNITRKIKGDLTLSGNASYSGGICLVKGTKIRLFNGSYKNIEDIEYDDLIQAFSHDLGKIVYEYPIWIEKEGIIDHYQRTTFSDGTKIETVGSHGIFSMDLMEYVSVLDKDKFKIGTKVLKIDENNNLKEVYVEKIETIYEEVKFYHVSSTRYHNVIANDLLTTDALLIISNMFKLEKDLTWNKERDKFLKEKDLFYYKDWDHLFLNHIFKGFRMEEAKYLYNKGELDIDIFAYFLNNFMKDTIKLENKNIWMVTTSDDLENNNKGSFYKEGSFYKVEEPNKKNGKFIGWYNTSDNKYYQPNDLIEVNYGMYLEAVWE